MLHLTIVRHAKTNQVSPTGSDFDRMLLPKGIAQGIELKNHFHTKGINYKEILVSSAKRTQQTFDLMSPGVSYEVRLDDPNFYLAEFQFLFKTLAKRQHSEPILLVGHNFGISDLATYLTESLIELRTGEVIHLSFECATWQEISKGTGIILERYRPEVV